MDYPDEQIDTGIHQSVNQPGPIKKGYFAMAMVFGDKLKISFFQLFQAVFFIATALIFSWIALVLLFMYMDAKEDG